MENRWINIYTDLDFMKKYIEAYHKDEFPKILTVVMSDDKIMINLFICCSFFPLCLRK